jgi:hypothetical protein
MAERETPRAAGILPVEAQPSGLRDFRCEVGLFGAHSGLPYIHLSFNMWAARKKQGAVLIQVKVQRRLGGLNYDAEGFGSSVIISGMDGCVCAARVPGVRNRSGGGLAL